MVGFWVFSFQNDRRLIIQMIFSTTTSPDEKTRMASYQCLCELARLYYIFLEPFIGELFNVFCVDGH